MKFNRNMLLLYAVTDRRRTDVGDFDAQVQAALRGGITMLQLREKEMSDALLLEEALRMKKHAHAYGVPLIVNDRWDIAWQAGADGVHVGIEDAPVAEIRKACGPGFIIGATAKTVAQAKAAEAAGADYLGVGAIFPSPTKKNALCITRAQLDEICRSVSIPVVAIGGITTDNLGELCGAKINGIALISSIFGAEDIEAAVRNLKEMAQKVISK